MIIRVAQDLESGNLAPSSERDPRPDRFNYPKRPGALKKAVDRAKSMPQRTRARTSGCDARKRSTRAWPLRQTGQMH